MPERRGSATEIFYSTNFAKIVPCLADPKNLFAKEASNRVLPEVLALICRLRTRVYMRVSTSVPSMTH